MYIKLSLNHQSSQPDLMTIRSVFSHNQLVSCKLTAESQVLQKSVEQHLLDFKDNAIIWGKTAKGKY